MGCTSPCKACENRHPNCHSECDNYKSWKADKDKERETMHKQAKINDDINKIMANRFKNRPRNMRW